MEINRILWLDDIVDKLHWKHNVETEEVIEVLQNKPRFVFKEVGFKESKDVYAAFGKTDSNRFLGVFFVYAKDKRAVIVPARDATDKERAKYAN